MRLYLISVALFSLPAMAQVGRLSWAGLDSSYAWENAAQDLYARGAEAIDNQQYANALRDYEEIKNGPRVEGALYWKAYSLNKLGRRDEAIAALGKLRQEHPASRWVEDAKILEAEVQQSNGKPAAEDPSNDEFKLLAINGLLAADPDRAIPQLDRLLKSNSSPKVKKRALFVLTQSDSPRAKQILGDVAKGGSNPDLQIQALRYIGMSGTQDSSKQLATIYAASNDAEVKRSIIRSLMISHGKDQLVDLARNEKQPDLRREAIRQLGVLNATVELKQLYGTETDAAVKKEVVNGLFISNDAKSLVELARKETNMDQKKSIVSKLSMMHTKDATDYMVEILK